VVEEGGKQLNHEVFRNQLVQFLLDMLFGLFGFLNPEAIHIFQEVKVLAEYSSGVLVLFHHAAHISA